MSISAIGSSAIAQWSSALFSRLDTKQQGYIDKTDVASALQGAGGNSTAADETNQLFSALDGNGDGKITETEFSSGLQSLAEALFEDLKKSGSQVGAPPPPPAGADEGFTKEELTTLAAESSDDSGRADLLGRLAANFDAADVDGNGRVDREEAMAYDAKSRETQSATAATGTNASSDSSALLRLAKLLSAYGISTRNPVEATAGIALSA